MSFKSLPIPLRTYILVAITTGAVVLGVVLAETTKRPHWLLVTLLVLCSIVFATWRVNLTIRGSVMTLTSAVVCLSMLLPGAGRLSAVLCAALGALIGTWVRPTPGRWFPRVIWNYHWYRTAFNVAICVLAAALAAACYDWAVEGMIAVSGDRRGSVSVMVVGATSFQIVYFIVNTLGVAAALSLTEGRGLLALWRENFLWTWPSYLASGSIAVGISAAYRNPQIGTWALLLLPPLYFIYYSYRLYLERTHLYVESVERDMRHVRELNELNSSIIASLATAIDAKDRCTRSHINRVQAYAESLGEHVGLSAPELEAVRTGALVHDIGKLGIPESILAKPGKLTPEEYELMQAHVVIGAEILAPVKFPYPVIPIVMTHHERWDGLGYPNGLKGEDIPIGGRIMAIADVFDALTSDRPYRRALRPEEALNVLRNDAGKHFDPHLVACFERILPEVLKRVAEIEVESPESTLPSAATSASDGDSSLDADWLNETLANLAELIRSVRSANSPSDAAHRVADHVLECFPVDAAVVYLYEPKAELLRATAVCGRFAGPLSQATLGLGKGVSGWVARTRVPQLNAQALLDLGPCFTPTDQMDLTAAAAIPLFHGDQTFGVLTVYSSSYNTLRSHHMIALNRIADCLTAVLLDLQSSDAPAGSEPGAPLAMGLRRLVEPLEEWANESRSNGTSAPSGFRLLVLEAQRQTEPGTREAAVRAADQDETHAWIAQLTQLLPAGADGHCVVCHYARDVFAVAMRDYAAADCEVVRDRLLQLIRTPGGAETSVNVGEARFPVDGTDAASLIAAAEQRLSALQLERGRAAR